MAHRVKVDWLRWRNVLGVLCNGQITIKLKEKCLRIVRRLAMLYGFRVGQWRNNISKKRVYQKWGCLDGQVLYNSGPNKKTKVYGVSGSTHSRQSKRD